MNTYSVESLGSIQKTLLIPVWARAIESRRENPILLDPIAESLLDQLDFDFNKFKAAWISQVGICLRAWMLDQWVLSCLQKFPNLTIVELGVGLDTRMERINHPSATWIEIDHPDTIELRKKFFQETTQRIFISRSIFDEAWMDDLQNMTQPPYLFIAEGVLPYHVSSDIQNLFIKMREHFPGAHFYFDSVHPLLVKLRWFHDTVRHFEVDYQWGLANPKRLKQWQQNIELIQSAIFYEIPPSVHQKIHPRPMRWLFKMPLFMQLYRVNAIAFSHKEA